MLEELFHHYVGHRGHFGAAARKLARQDGWPRVICDYLAGMTDRYAMQEHKRVFELKEAGPGSPLN